MTYVGLAYIRRYKDGQNAHTACKGQAGIPSSLLLPTPRLALPRAQKGSLPLASRDAERRRQWQSILRRRTKEMGVTYRRWSGPPWAFSMSKAPHQASVYTGRFS